MAEGSSVLLCAAGAGAGSGGGGGGGGGSGGGSGGDGDGFTAPGSARQKGAEGQQS